MDIVTLALARKYIKSSITEAGGVKGDDGQSAYELAVALGFEGTESEWIQSLSGKSPYIGDNNNWWINGVDTGVSAQVENASILTSQIATLFPSD